MATTLTLPLADVCKLLEENADRTAKRVASELEPVIAALSRKLEERSNDSERVYAALMTVLSGAQKVQFKIAYEATGHKNSRQKSAPTWRETAPEDSSDDEESTPQLPKPWVIKRGLVSVTEGIRTLGLGSEVSSPDSKPFWDPTGRNVSVTSHDNRKGQAKFEQSSKQLTPLHIMAKVPKWDEPPTSSTSPGSTCSALSSCGSTPPSSPPSIATPSSSPPPSSASSPSSPSPPTPSPAARVPLSAQQQSPTSVKSHSLTELSTASPALAPPPAPQGFPQNAIQAPSVESPAARKLQDEDKTAGVPSRILPALTVKVQDTTPITLDTGMDSVVATTPAITLNARATTQNMGGGPSVRVTPVPASVPAPFTANASTSTATDSSRDVRMDDAPASVKTVTDTTQFTATDAHMDDTPASVDTTYTDTTQAAAADAQMDDTPASVNTTANAIRASAAHVQQPAASSSAQVTAASVSPQDTSSPTADQASQATSDAERLPLNIKEFKTAHAAKTGPLTTLNVGMKRKAADGKYSEWSKPTVIQCDPEIFDLPASEDYDNELFCSIRKTVRRNEKMAKTQAWFEAFCPSTLEIPCWASCLSHRIRNHADWFENLDDGQNPTLREKYKEFTNLTKACGHLPDVWKFRPWLEKIVLPFLVTEFSPELTLIIPVSDTISAGLPTANRTDSLLEIFQAIAKAYLRMVLLKAQGPYDKMDLSRYGGPTLLPNDAVVNWEVLEDMASSIEVIQANKFGKDVQAGRASLATYRSSVEFAIRRFGTGHASLERQIVTVRQNSAERLEDMHERWSSPDAYLKDAEAQHKLVSDSGVQYLQYRLKLLDLSQRGVLVDPALHNNDSIELPERMRRTVFREIITRLCVADDEFSAINQRSIYSASSNILGEVTATALELEAGILQGVTQLAAQISLTPGSISEIYANKAQMLQARLIDFPLDTLKECVLYSHGDGYVPTVMTAANSSIHSARGGQTIIETVPHSSSMRGQDIIEPPLKRRRHHGECGDCALSGTPSFYFNDQMPSGHIDHELEVNQALDDCYNEIWHPDSDYDSDDYDSDDYEDGGSDDGDDAPAGDGDDFSDYDGDDDSEFGSDGD
ncbi:hypothetical protein HBI79_057450 [Parastagonospora nodorum]|nr:hypothetical protein HBI79_057450 [Parastagonospora nodorum]